MTQSLGFWDIFIKSSALAGPVVNAAMAARHAADRSRLRIKVLLRTPSVDGPSAPAAEGCQKQRRTKRYKFEGFSASSCHPGGITDGAFLRALAAISQRISAIPQLIVSKPEPI